MKKLLVSVLIICSSFTYAETPNKLKLENHKTPGSVQWLRSPKPSYTNIELGGKDRDLTIKLFVSDTGIIEKTEVVKSSGIAMLDEKVLRAVKRSKFKPYLENGVAYPFSAEQPFVLKTTINRPWWKKILFIS